MACRRETVGVRTPSGPAEFCVAIPSILAAGAADVAVDLEDPDKRASRGPECEATRLEQSVYLVSHSSPWGTTVAVFMPSSCGRGVG